MTAGQAMTGSARSAGPSLPDWCRASSVTLVAASRATRAAGINGPMKKGPALRSLEKRN